MAKLSVIIPCYFNEANIPVTGRALVANEKRFSKGTQFEYVFVDDASGDNTFAALKKFQRTCPHAKIVHLTRNVGSNKASVVGLKAATGDCFAILAADLQDPPQLLPGMFSHWKKGVKLVVATRISRQDDTVFSQIFHFLMRRLAFPNAPAGGFDLCLFDREIRDTVLKRNDKYFFLPYLLLSLGVPYVAIPYTRKMRTIGRSRWTLRKKIASLIDALIMIWKVRRAS